MSEACIPLGVYMLDAAPVRRDLPTLRYEVESYLRARHGGPCRPVDGPAPCYCPTCRRWRAVADVFADRLPSG